jgi:ribosomal protein L11 methyltransferase
MLRVHTTQREAVIAALFDAGAGAIQDEGPSITTHFPDDVATRGAAAAVARVDSAASIEIEDTPPADYSTWRASVSAWEVGALTVCPPWLASGRDPAKTIVIDPAMAFGTGEHPTTRGTLLLMQNVLRPGDSVADLGTGSGVLAIAAAKLGAAGVAGIEHDVDAIANAEANVRANGVDRSVAIVAGDAGTLLPLLAPVRVVLANIASLALLQLLPVIGAALSADGVAVISGVLVSESQGFRARMQDWRTLEEHVEGDWWTAAIARL